MSKIVFLIAQKTNSPLLVNGLNVLTDLIDHIDKQPYIIGVDVGGTQVSAGVIDSKGRMVARVSERMNIPDYIKDKPVGNIRTIQELDAPAKIRCKNRIVRNIAELIIRAARDAWVSPEDIGLIGVGTPGDIQPDGRVKLAYNVPFQGINLKEEIREAVRELIGKDVSVSIENDMETAVVGESNQPYAKDFPKFTYMTVSTGVNAARYERATMKVTNFELGTREIEKEAKTVTLESLTSGEAIARIAQGQIKQGRDSKILGLAGGKVNDITAKEVGIAVKEGDGLAFEIIEEIGVHLGWGMVELIKQYVEEGNALPEELFVIGGGVTKIGKPLKDAIERGVEKAAAKVEDVTLPKIKIVFSKVGPDRGIIGAVEIARRQEKDETVMSIEPDISLLQPFLRDLCEDDQLIQNMLETIISILRSNKKLVLAFHKNIGGFKSKKLQMLLRLLSRLKEREEFEPFLKDLTIIQSFSSSENPEDLESLSAQLERHDIDITDAEHNIVFTFAPTAEKIPVSGRTIQQVFINEGKTFDSFAYYYPLFEIVTITLVKYRHKYSRDAIYAILDSLGIDRQQLNIEEIDETKDAFLIFTLMQKIKRYNIDDNIDKYVRLMRSIKSAA